MQPSIQPSKQPTDQPSTKPTVSIFSNLCIQLFPSHSVLFTFALPSTSWTFPYNVWCSWWDFISAYPFLIVIYLNRYFVVTCIELYNIRVSLGSPHNKCPDFYAKFSAHHAPLSRPSSASRCAFSPRFAERCHNTYLFMISFFYFLCCRNSHIPPSNIGSDFKAQLQSLSI